MSGPSAAAPALLEVRGLVKAFGGLTAVARVSFDVSAGSVVAIIGPNGAGKTTLLHLVSGILPVTAGEVHFKGQRIDALPAHRICGLGMNRSFQNLQLFAHLSVLDNVMIGCYSRARATFLEAMLGCGRVRREEREAVERAMQALAFFGLEDKARRMPASLALKERKFLGIARALATGPALLLLDEPVGGLTVGEIGDVGTMILRLREAGITVVFVEHRMELVSGFSERVIVMDFGEKIADGGFGEIQADARVIAAYLGRDDE